MNALISYIRDENGVPFGCVAAVSKTQFGVSLCNKQDTFRKNVGREMAIGRAVCHHNHSFHVPVCRQHAVVKALAKMADRAERYYK